MNKNIKIATTMALVALVGTAQAEIIATAVGGYDTNPFKLSDALNNDEGFFLDTKLRYDQELGNGFGVDLRGRFIAYDNNDQDADKKSFSAALMYEGEGSVLRNVTKYGFRMRYSVLDQSYISRVTGQTGQFAGQTISDRFDADWFDARARADIQLSENTSLRLEVEGRDKMYEDYTSTGLSNLDYTQIGGSASLRFRPAKAHDIRASVGYSSREFDNRFGRDLLGAFVLGTNLEYSYVDAGVNWKYDLSKKQDIKAAYLYKTREDNVSGYYDTTTNSVNFRYRYKISDAQRLALKAGYTDYDYDNFTAANIIDNEEPVGPKDGPTFSVSYDHRLSENDKSSLWLVSEASTENFDSVNPDYIYDRTRAYVGLKAEF